LLESFLSPHIILNSPTILLKIRDFASVFVNKYEFFLLRGLKIYGKMGKDSTILVAWRITNESKKP